MGWLRRSRRSLDLGRFVAPTPSPEPSMDDLVEEGQLLSAAAVRLAIKNRIITGSLRDELDYDEARYIAAVADELLALAVERETDAERIAAHLAAARSRPGRAEHFHDYHDVDAEALRRREDYSRRLAERLRGLAGDEDFARGTAALAHEAAWGEIAASVKARLTRAATIGDEPDYVIDRMDRLRDLARDLKRDLKRREPRP